ncbi:TPA: hypothetical protein P0E30_003729 [Vibrio harveyi]|nr:hypothetical protein [Vibrio harveyi]
MKLTTALYIVHGLLFAYMTNRFGAINSLGIYAASYELKNVIRSFKFVRF